MVRTKKDKMVKVINEVLECIGEKRTLLCNYPM